MWSFVSQCGHLRGVPQSEQGGGCAAGCTAGCLDEKELVLGSMDGYDSEIRRILQHCQENYQIIVFLFSAHLSFSGLLLEDLVRKELNMK